MRDDGATLRDISLAIDRILSESFRTRFPDPVWSKAIGMRNILVHHYLEIDHELVWQVVEDDLPAFRKVVESALGEIQEESQAGDEPPG